MSALHALRDYVLAEPGERSAPPPSPAAQIAGRPTAGSSGRPPDASGGDPAPAPSHLQLLEAPAASAAGPARDVVLGPPQDALAAGVALLHARRATATSPAGVLAVWHAPSPGGVPGLPTAARLAERMRRRDCVAKAAGRAVVVALPDEDAAAAQSLRRMLAAGLGVPVVLVLAGARGPALDALLDRFDVALVAGLDPRLGELAAATLPVAARTVPAVGPLDRALGRLGCARRSRRRAVR